MKSRAPSYPAPALFCFSFSSGGSLRAEKYWEIINECQNTSGQDIAFVFKGVGFRVNVLHPSPIHILQSNPQGEGASMGGD